VHAVGKILGAITAPAPDQRSDAENFHAQKLLGEEWAKTPAATTAETRSL